MRPATKDTWIVTLRTPAVLCDIEAVLSGLNSAHAAYAKYFARESFNTLELVRHFAEQRLSGGGYLWREFQESKKYRPYVMTQPGSTFVLKLAGDEQAANDKLANWLRSGLPVSAEVPDGQDLRTCPYVPENGFGEIIVNQDWQGEGVGR